MAKPQTGNTPAAATSAHGITDGFTLDVRGLPMYSADGDEARPETRNLPIRGHRVGAAWLPGEKAPFGVLIMKLTAPTMARIDGKEGPLIDVKAGEYIFVPGANLDDLYMEALHPKLVWEYILTPEAKRKVMKVGKMVKYRRERALVPANRADITPEYAHVMSPGEFITARELKAREISGGGTDFDPEAIEAAAAAAR